ncbi:hypothetical protein J2X68_007690 [Streptomyces sp. 3330]|nr:hypothetical protein [Streptomyces sp. 3330]MDR6980948.1 hypothetical protein [Streptomyces sp. 3330]
MTHTSADAPAEAHNGVSGERAMATVVPLGDPAPGMTSQDT